MNWLYEFFLNQPPLSSSFILLCIVGLIVALGRFYQACDERQIQREHGTIDKVPPEIRGNPEAIRKWLDSQPNPLPKDNNEADSLRS